MMGSAIEFDVSGVFRLRSVRGSRRGHKGIPRLREARERLEVRVAMERILGPEARLEVRRGTLADAPAMGRVAYRIVDLDARTGTAECARILREPFAFSAVAFHRLPNGEARLVGAINGALLRPAFAEKLLRSERPYFHRRVAEATEPPFPQTEAEVGQANAEEGLDLFLTHFAFDADLNLEEGTRARLMLVPYFVERFAGNRLRSLMVDTVGRENTAAAQSAGWETVTTFPAWRREHGVAERDGPHLMRITLDGAMGAQNLHMARLLQYEPPRLRFPSGARDLLRAALNGEADREYAARHGITPKSVDSAWDRIRGIVTRTMPDLLPSEAGEAKTGARRALLAYLRHYPEALWPYE